jgi:hypothetical protein
MKKLLKWAVIGLTTLIAIGTIGVLILSQEKPAGSNSKEADILAQKMLTALNKEAFDTIKYLQWTFADRHTYLWDKSKNMVIISIKNTEILLDLDAVKGKILKGDLSNKDKLVEKAWSNWCNDSFWILAPFKVFDPGTERYIVNDDGKEGLEIKYTSGGVTPGDSYVWFLDDNYIPTGYKMWVKIIPVGGTYASWEDWITLPSGAKIAQLRKMKVFDLVISNIKEGTSFSDFGFSEDPFQL